MIARILAEALRLLRAGRADEAARIYDRILSEDPHHAAALHGLGLVRMAEGRAGEAVALLRRVLCEEPGWAAAHTDLGTALQALGRADEAIGHYAKAAELRPGNAAALSNLGCALQALGRPEAARRAFAEAVAARPDDAAAHLNLGNVLLELGEMAAAERALAGAVALAPRRPATWRALGQVRRFGEADLAALQAVDADGLDDDESADLHFALAKALADTGRPRQSVPHLLEGNRLVRRRLAYDEAGTLAELDSIRAAFPAARLSAPADSDDESAAAVFVFGMPRSGTTLVEQILASHSRVFGAGELPDLDRAARAAGFPAEAGDGLLRRLGRDHLARLRELAPEALRVVDKTPANFRFAGLVALALPGARMIHVRRDPLDTCLSCFATRFAAGQPFAYDLAELGRYHRACSALMAHWRRCLPAGVLLEVEYEALVADPEGQARRLLGHCGLEWEPACLEFHRTPRPVRTASAAQVRRPISAGSVGRARAYGELLRPLAEALEG